METEHTKATLVLIHLELFRWAGLTHPCALHQSAKTNCLVLTNGEKARGVQFSIQRRGKAVLVAFETLDTTLPVLSYNTEIRDVFWNKAGLLIFRWPLWLYDKGFVTPHDKHRSIDRQRRESELIEKSFPPLGNRPRPYPFFAPTLTLDPFWSPATQPPI